ncbi:MAG: carbamoyl-phosphate synthase domain-containing protein [Rickettsiaceae bacterium]
MLSYASQSVVFTYLHIGITGINNEDNQSENIYLDSIIVRNFCDYRSSQRMTTN